MPLQIDSTKDSINEVDIILAFGYGVVLSLSGRVVWLQFHSSPRISRTSMFYLLVLAASFCRFCWFVLETRESSFPPQPVYAWHGKWLATFSSNIINTFGSLILYSIFLLIIVSWAHLLEGVHNTTQVNSVADVVSLIVVFLALSLFLVNYLFFFAERYSTLWMTCYDSLVIIALSVISIICLSMYSRRIQTVLKAFSDMRCDQTKRRLYSVIRSTIICTLFLSLNMSLELFTVIRIFIYEESKSNFSSNWWRIIFFIKHLIQIIMMLLLLFVLWGGKHNIRKEGYEEIQGYSSDDVFESIGTT